MNKELLIEQTNSVSLYSTVIPYGGFFNEEDVRKILARFEKEETVLTRSGQRVTDDFRKTIRKISGKKEDYMQLSFQEKAAEARERIIKDLKVAREEIKTRNPVDYLLDRALDPLDPMNVFYKTVLKKMGAEVNEESNTIRLSPQLTAIYERKGNIMNIEDQNMPQQLPSFRGYIIDKRLREFRKIEFGRMPEFIPFESPQGQNILMDMAKGRGIPYNSPDFETKVLKQYTDNTIIARIEQIQTDKTAKTSEIILKTNSEKLSLTINEKQARKLSEGAEIVISRNENGIKINVLNVERSRTLKR